MTELLSSAADEYLNSALAAVRSGEPGLANLGWYDLLPAVTDDPEIRRALFTVFRAQGAERTDTGALGALMALPYLQYLHAHAGPVSATMLRTSARRGLANLLAGPLPEGDVLIDVPGTGVHMVASVDIVCRPIDVPGGLNLQEILVDLTGRSVVVTEDYAALARRRSLSLGRIALAFDMLGAAEAALAIAVQYAGDRQQFGQPIGRFQAIRHLLAEARVDCAAIEAVVDQALLLGDTAPVRYDEVVKALAGRNARRVCQRALQTLGGIGFTIEHPHHSFHSRVLTLDGLLGSSAELSAALAASCDSPGRVDELIGTPIPGLAR